MAEHTKSWLTSRDMLNFFVHTRDKDVKVSIDGLLVPIRGVYYYRNADAYVIELDDTSEDYKIAFADAHVTPPGATSDVYAQEP